MLVGEQQVDRAAVDHLGKGFAAAGDAHAFAQREGDLAACPMRNVDRAHHRGARQFGAEQIAFEVEDRGRRDQLLVERGRGEEVRRAG